MKRSTRIAISSAALLVMAPAGTVAAQSALTPVDLQLAWFAQSQFGGFYAAKDLGYYEDMGLDVTLHPVDENLPTHILGSEADGPEFTISWAPRVIELYDQDATDLVNIAQHLQRSGTLSLAWQESGINAPEDFAGKKVGVWDQGLDLEVVAAGRAVGLEADEHYRRVPQDFNTTAFQNREIDVAEAMIYNEYAQVLETVDPRTNELYQPEDMNVIDYNDVGTAMLQDGIWARDSWLSEADNEDLATRFLAATFRGWQYCRDNAAECVEIVTANGSVLGQGHQAWMMNEINALVWPSPEGVGAMPQETWDTTVQILLDAEIITEDPGDGLYRTDLAAAARAMVEGDLTGEGYEKAVVQVTPGGK